MDDDLEGMTRAELLAEVRRLRRGIREHRDSTGHELCWHHPKLWGQATPHMRAWSPARRPYGLHADS